MQKICLFYTMCALSMSSVSMASQIKISVPEISASFIVRSEKPTPELVVGCTIPKLMSQKQQLKILKPKSLEITEISEKNYLVKITLPDFKHTFSTSILENFTNCGYAISLKRTTVGNYTLFSHNLTLLGAEQVMYGSEMTWKETQALFKSPSTARETIKNNLNDLEVDLHTTGVCPHRDLENVDQKWNCAEF